MTAEQLRAESLRHGKAVRCIQEEFTLNPSQPATPWPQHARFIVYHDHMRQRLYDEALAIESQEKAS